MREMPTAPSPNRLRELREKRGEFRWQLAQVVGRDPSRIQAWEAGATIPMEVAVTLAEHFDVSLDYLIGRDERQAA